MDGTATVGTSLLFARQDHIHPSDTTRAPLASPTFTGDPKAPTPTAGDADTSIATTAFVTGAVAAASAIPAGTVMLFYQAAAPTGWTKLTTNNDKALRVVSGSGGVGGGSVAFSTVFARTMTDDFTLATTHIPFHNHATTSVSNVQLLNYAVGGSWDYTPGGQSRSDGNTFVTGGAGAGSAHNHTIDLRVQYLDLILASKN
jgi:hypothetical protein